MKPRSPVWGPVMATSVVVGALGLAAVLFVDTGTPFLPAVIGAGGAAVLASILLGVGRARRPSEPDTEPRQLEGHLGYPCGCADPGRRQLLRRGALGGGALLGALAVLPLWRATQRAEQALRRTAWRPGARLVDNTGRPLRATDLEDGAFTTVWPAGHRGDGDSPAVLIRLHPGRELTGSGRDDWVAEGHVAYSKLCTHMGCPVGLYQSEADLLVCPCHQATFDVLRGALPVHGPARRALPQLPLAVDNEGYFIATGDFPEPVGPAYWSRPS